MRRGNWRAALLATVGAVLLCAGPQAAEPGDIIEIGPGAYPQWSPDGKYLAFVRGGHLIAAPADGTGPETEIAKSRGKRFIWASNSEIVFGFTPRTMKGEPEETIFESVRFERLVDSTGKTMGIDEITELSRITTVTERNSAGQVWRIYGPVRMPSGEIGYQVRTGLNAGLAHFVSLRSQIDSSETYSWPRAIVLDNGEPPRAPWGDIWLTWYGASTTERKQLTHDQTYGMPILAPTGDKILLSDGQGTHLIIDTMGNVVNPRFDELNPISGRDWEEFALHKWSPNGELICFDASVTDGHIEKGNRALVRGIDGAFEMELLDEEWGVAEGAVWSPASTHVALVTRRAGIVVVEVRK